MTRNRWGGRIRSGAGADTVMCRHVDCSGWSVDETAFVGAEVPRSTRVVCRWPYVWWWRVRLGDRKGQPCRVVARGRMGSVLVEFPDGHRVVTSRYAVRRRPWA